MEHGDAEQTPDNEYIMCFFIIILDHHIAYIQLSKYCTAVMLPRVIRCHSRPFRLFRFLSVLTRQMTAPVRVPYTIRR